MGVRIIPTQWRLLALPGLRDVFAFWPAANFGLPGRRRYAEKLQRISCPGD